MSRSNDGSTGNFISIADITAARFLRADAWTVITFFRLNSSGTDDNGLISKWKTSGNQFLLRTDNQAAPTNLEVYCGSAGAIINGASSLALNTWYATAVTCSGLGTAGDVTLHTFELDGTVIDDGLTGTHTNDDADVTEVTRLICRDSGNDNLDGDQAHAAYFKSALSKQDILDYIRSPARLVARKSVVGGGVAWYFPMGLSSPEVDMSGSGVDGTITGTLTITDNPPTMPMYGLGSIIPLLPAVDGGGATIPISFKNTNKFRHYIVR